MKELIYYVKRINNFDDTYIPSEFMCIKRLSLECYKAYLNRFENEYSDYVKFEVRLHLLMLNCSHFISHYESLYDMVNYSFHRTYYPFYTLCKAIIKYYNIERNK